MAAAERLDPSDGFGEEDEFRRRSGRCPVRLVVGDRRGIATHHRHEVQSPRRAPAIDRGHRDRHGDLLDRVHLVACERDEEVRDPRRESAAADDRHAGVASVIIEPAH
jgi:hypothetical protein